MNRVLIIAYHFPPVAGSSGVLRALKLCRYLPENGWQPTVLTVNPRAYERTDPGQLAEIPADVHVFRTFALDTQRHLSIGGRYLRSMALPDRWASWVPSGVLAGLRAIRRERIDAIFSTFPIPSAVLIGWILHRLTGKPWIVDLRDSMTEDDYPRDPATRRSLRRLEARAVRDSSRILFTAASTIAMYRERYPSLTADKCVLVPNGYDEDDFQNLQTSAPHADISSTRPLRLLHLGLLYPSERDPRPFFRALARLKSERVISPASIQRRSPRQRPRRSLHQNARRIRCQRHRESPPTAPLPRSPSRRLASRCPPSFPGRKLRSSNSRESIRISPPSPPHPRAHQLHRRHRRPTKFHRRRNNSRHFERRSNPPSTPRLPRHGNALPPSCSQTMASCRNTAVEVRRERLHNVCHKS